MQYFLHLLTEFSILSMIAISLNFIVGYCGLISLGHAGFVTIGGYCYAILRLVSGWSFFPALCISIIVTSSLSLLLSVPAWRMKREQFTLLSLVFQIVILTLAMDWVDEDAPLGSFSNLTNGPYGIAGVPRPTAGEGDHGAVLLCVIAVLMCSMAGLLSYRLLSSPFGRLLRALRDDELAARGLGKNVRLALTRTFAISCGMAGAAGALQCSQLGYINPTAASLDESVMLLSVLIIGGSGNVLAGPLVGAGSLLLLRELLRFFNLGYSSTASWQLLMYGLVLVILLRLRPQGLAGSMVWHERNSGRDSNFVMRK